LLLTRGASKWSARGWALAGWNGCRCGRSAGFDAGDVELLYEVQPTDPQTFVAVTTALAIIALVACGVPAFKAARVDPAVALRHL
jgi:hypothetical protein